MQQGQKNEEASKSPKAEGQKTQKDAQAHEGEGQRGGDNSAKI